MNLTKLALIGGAAFLAYKIYQQRNQQSAQPVNTGANTATVADDYLAQVHSQPVTGQAAAPHDFTYTSQDIIGRGFNPAMGF